MEVVIDYEPREQFARFHDRQERWAAIVAHRRAGKTVACVHDLNRAALTKPKARFAYVAPFYAQAKDVAWGYIKEAAAPVPGVTFNEGELRVNYPNGSMVRLYGADNYDRLRGISLDGVVMDEYGDMEPRAWSEVIRPALADKKGWAVFIGTPKGHNAFFETCEHARKDEGWFYMALRASETGILDAEELADARAMMTEDQYAQEFECSFDAAIQGAFYANEFRLLEADKRIARVPWQPSQPVHTAWDLGIDDATAIWFIQLAGREVHVLDYLEVSGESLHGIAKRLAEKPYTFGQHFLPHDAEARELGTGESRTDTLRKLGVRATVLPQERVEDGINAARILLARCWFDENKCERGLECLKQYRREFDEKRKVFRERPLHDWTSHAADAFRYLAMGIDRISTSKPAPLKMADFGAV